MVAIAFVTQTVATKITYIDAMGKRGQTLQLVTWFIIDADHDLAIPTAIVLVVDAITFHPFIPINRFAANKRKKDAEFDDRITLISFLFTTFIHPLEAYC